MVDYIDQHRELFGVAPICEVLQVAPSTYYTAKARPPSKRQLRDDVISVVMVALWQVNYSVYGARKMWKAMHRAGHTIGRDQVARLMRHNGLRGIRRGAQVFTTRPDKDAGRAPDLVKRDFTADRPNALWVTDLTYVATWSGMVYVCFITDVFSRTIVGWTVATNMRTQMVLDTLEHARFNRGAVLESLVCHSDAGAQFTSIRYGERLAELGAQPSIGTVGDSYDNALAETINGLYKTELIRRRGPWRTVDDVELATLQWVHWFNTERLHSALGDVPPAEFESAYDAHRSTSQLVETQ